MPISIKSWFGLNDCCLFKNVVGDSGVPKLVLIRFFLDPLSVSVVPLVLKCGLPILFAVLTADSTLRSKFGAVVTINQPPFILSIDGSFKGASNLVLLL